MTFSENLSAGVLYMTAPDFPARHAFTTRKGGVSRGIYESLNLSLSVGDDETLVLENYARLRRALSLPEEHMVFSHQVHGDIVRPVTEADCHRLMTDVPYEADGLITDRRGLVLAVFSADCTPILLCDRRTGAVGAVHAGWRGTALDIAGKAVCAMAREYGCRPGDITAAIGPCISACCFETGPEVPEAMHAVLGPGADTHIRPALTDGKYFVDLKGINRALLMRAGVLPENIRISDECTSCQNEKYWSHRATGGRRGSQASIIICG